MKKEINKIVDLKNTEAFIQVNTIKGFKYIDKAGEIVNLYHLNNAPPKFAMSLQALDIQNPTQQIELLKTSAQMIWMKFLEPGSLELIENNFLKEFEKIKEILAIEKVGRIGWRNHFVYEFTSKSEQTICAKKFLPIADSSLSSINFNIKTGDKFQATLILQPVVKNDKDKTPGMLLDLDIFLNEIMDIAQIPKLLKKFKEFLKSEDGFLKTVNQIV